MPTRRINRANNIMVTIVNKEPDKSVLKEIVCGNCGVTLSYVPREVQSYHGTDYSGGSDGQEWVDCPNCNEKAIIKSW